MKQIFTLLISVAFSTLSAITYTWTGTTDTDWGTSTNWSPNGIPGLGDDVIISSTTNQPVLDQIRAVSNITYNSGTLDLGSHTLAVHENGTFNGGTINNGSLFLLDALTANTHSLNNTTFGAAVNITGSVIDLNGNTFNSTADVTFIGTVNVASVGGNTFNGASTFVNNGSARWRMCNTTGNTYNADVTFKNTGSNYLEIGRKGANAYNGDIYISSTSGTGIRMGQGGGATNTLASGQQLLVHSDGFTTGDFRINRFTQVGSTAQNLTFTGTAKLNIQGNDVTFNGNLTFVGPRFDLDGGTFNGVTNLTKNGASTDSGSGGCVFNAALTMTNSGSGTLKLGTAAADTFNSTVALASTGSNRIQIANGGTSTFADDITLESTGSSTGIEFGQDAAGGTITLGATKTITFAGGGFTAGNLKFYGLDYQNTTPINWTLSNSIVTFGDNGTWTPAITLDAKGILLNGYTFSGAASFTKSGTGNSYSEGGNTFSSTFNFTHSGTNTVRLCSTNGDIYSGDVTLSSTGSGRIEPSRAGVSSFNGNLTINSTGSSTGIRFGQDGGTSTLDVASSFAIGGSGFSAGDLYLNGMNFQNSAAINLTFTGTQSLRVGGSSSFAGNVTFSSPRIYLNGATYNGTATISKTGASNDTGDGGNTFNGVTVISNSGSGRLRMANTSGDTFNAQVTFTNTSNSQIQPAYSGANTFNGNIILNSSGTSDGIRFGNGGGTSTVDAAATLSFGGSGFTAGDFYLDGFTYQNTGALSFTFSTAGQTFAMGSNSSFAGNVTFSAPVLLFSNTTFNGTANLTKSGDGANNCAGGNTFKGVTTITNTSDSRMVLANAAGDTFEANVTFSNSGDERMEIADLGSNVFQGNILLNSTGSSAGIRFGEDGGTSTLSSGQTLQIGTFDEGDFYLGNFTQNGTTAQSMSLGGTSQLRIQNSCVFNGTVDFDSPELIINGSTFNNTTDIEKTGGTNNNSSGGNTFNGATTIRNSGTGVLRFASTTGDDYNGTATFIRTGGNINPCYGAETTFAGDISITSTNGFTLSNNGGTASLDGAGAQQISSSHKVNLYNFKISDGSGLVTLNQQIDLNNTASVLTLGNRDLDLNGNDLTLTNPDGAGMSVGSGSIRTERTDLAGKINWEIGTNTDAHVIPLGNASGEVFPFTITPTSGDIGTFSIATYPTADNNTPWGPGVTNMYLSGTTDDNSANVINRFWEIEETGTGGAVNIVFTYADSEIPSGGEGSGFNAQRWSNSANSWEIPSAGQSALTGTNSVTVPNVSDFSIWALSKIGSVLPVELVAFDAEAKDDHTELSWTTASEINNDHFDVEHSVNGIDFEKVGEVDGVGNTNDITEYSFDHLSPISGTNYYRLKQVDFDGKYEYSEIISVEFDSQMSSPISVSQNVVNPGQSVWISANEVLKGHQLVLVDLNGRVIMDRAIDMDGKSTPFEIPSDIQSGIYLLNVRNGNEDNLFKLLVN